MAQHSAVRYCRIETRKQAVDWPVLDRSQDRTIVDIFSLGTGAVQMNQSDRFAILKATQRIWVIAAIHGDLDRLVAIHDEIARSIEPGDRIVYTGNYFGYGTHMVAVLDELVRFRLWFLSHPPYQHPDDIIHLRGAQEEMWVRLMQLQFAPDPETVLTWMRARGVPEMVDAIGLSFSEGAEQARGGTLALTNWTNRLREATRVLPGHDALLSGLKRAAYTENGRLLFVHTGLDPSKALSRQSDALWWASKSFADIQAPYRGFQKVVRGYDPDARGLIETDYTLSLDGGCGRGGALYAVRLSVEGEIDENFAA